MSDRDISLGEVIERADTVFLVGFAFLSIVAMMHKKLPAVADDLARPGFSLPSSLPAPSIYDHLSRPVWFQFLNNLVKVLF